jgi:nitrilase
MTKLVVAVAQATPAPLDLDATIDKACALVAEAGRLGARLLAFPETWVPGYPFWCDDGAFACWGRDSAKSLHARFVESSLVLSSAQFARVCAAAREAGVAVVLGANEREACGSSVYNALLFVDEHGALVSHRRKLVPTFGERLVWCPGDAVGLEASPMCGTRVGGMICWEHWMPVARHVLHSSGEEVHVAAWPHGREPHQLASRHYAFEGRTFVLAAATFLRRADLPGDFPLIPDCGEWPDTILAGGSAILAPDGSYIVEPLFDCERLLVAEIELDRTRAERLTLDVVGHYARPDLFDVTVRRDRPMSVREG